MDDLEEDKDEESVEGDGLEVEKVGVAADALQPGDPHEEGVSNAVDEAADDYVEAFHVLEDQGYVHGQSEEDEVHVVQGRVLVEQHLDYGKQEVAVHQQAFSPSLQLMTELALGIRFLVELETPDHMRDIHRQLAEVTSSCKLEEQVDFFHKENAVLKHGDHNIPECSHGLGRISDIDDSSN